MVWLRSFVTIPVLVRGVCFYSDRVVLYDCSLKSDNIEQNYENTRENEYGMYNILVQRVDENET